MKKLLLATTFCFISSGAWAQCNGVFPPNTICGNNTAAPQIPAPVPPFIGGVAGTGAAGQVATWSNATTITGDPALTYVAGGTLSLGATLNLGLVSTTSGKLVLLNSSNSNQTIITPGAATASKTYTWPTNTGVAGSVLTDAAGNGTLSWAPPGSFPGTVAQLTFGGNVSQAAWGTAGVRIVRGSPNTLTDTTSTGTVAAAASWSMGNEFIAASNATTYTDYYNAYLQANIASTNVTFTRNWGLGVVGNTKIWNGGGGAALLQVGDPATSSGGQIIIEAGNNANALTLKAFGSAGYLLNFPFAAPNPAAGQTYPVQFLGSDNGGQMTWTSINPPGSNKNILFNNNGFWGGSAGLTYDDAGRAVTLTGTGGNPPFFIALGQSGAQAAVSAGIQGNSFGLATAAVFTDNNGYLGLGGGSATEETALTRDAAGVMGLHNIINLAAAATFRVYNSSNLTANPTTCERGVLDWTSNVFTVGTQTCASGTARPMILAPAALYNAGGPALPACSAGTKGWQTVVSDATAPTYNANYVSGGAVVAHVVCNGTNWVTQ